jgi:CheY-like chemotaxis protein
VSRILVIDDEPQVCELVLKVLGREGHLLECAYDGEAGLDKFRAAPFDLVIVDKNLPRMHGGEVIVAVRKLKPTVAVILMTAFPEPFALPPERLDAYLAKPFKSLKAIGEAVAQALAASEAAQRREALRVKVAQVVAELTPPKKRV